MSIVGTQRIPGTRCLVWVTRASRALTGSLRMDWGVRPRASYVRQSPVRPSQQPTLKRHRGHWNVPWRHSITAAQRGQGSTAGSGAVSAGGEAAIPSTVRGAPDGCRGVGAPYPLGTPTCTGRPHSGRPGSPLSRPHVRESRNASFGTRCPHARTAALPGFTLFLQIAEATSGSAGGVVLLARPSPTSPRLDANPPRHRTLLCPGVQKCPAMATPTDDLCAPVRSHREKRYS